MIVIGADTHKQSHTVAAVDAATGRLIGDNTVRARRRAFDDLLVWARDLDAERVWALEDCRHVSGALERFLLRRGEQVVRIAPKLAAGARTTARERGKSDVIDAGSIARAALREGLATLPIAQLAGPEQRVDTQDACDRARAGGDQDAAGSQGHIRAPAGAQGPATL